MNPLMQKLYRDTENKIFSGVCAGIAKRYGWDPSLVRLATLLSCSLPGPQVLVYIAAAIIIPAENRR